MIEYPTPLFFVTPLYIASTLFLLFFIANVVSTDILKNKPLIN